MYLVTETGFEPVPLILRAFFPARMLAFIFLPKLLGHFEMTERVISHVV